MTNHIQRFFKRYVHSSVKLFCFFIVVNVVLFIGLTAISGSRNDHNPTKLLSAISEELPKKIEDFSLSEVNRDLLDQDQAWCMVINNESGDVVWNYQLPEELLRHYTHGDIAEMSRWYLQEYPVFVSNEEPGLFVLGYPKDSFWKLSAYKTSTSIKIDVFGLITLFLINIMIVLILFIYNSRKIEKCIKPILVGIEEISSGRHAQLTEKGELSEINAKLNKVAKSLQRRDMARANWISGISHDIRTPLSMVLGYSSSLEESHTLSPDQQDKVSAISQQAARIKNLIEDLNLTSKLEYDMQPLRLSKLSPVELARQVVCDFLDSGLEEKYSIEFLSDPQSELYHMEGDEALLKRALTNLIQNSIRHNPEGCEIIVSVSCNESDTRVVIEDNGIGVSAQKLAELNSKSHYLESTDENLRLRHGLGVLLVRQITEAHHGTMTMQSMEGNGFKTTLSFSA